MKKDSYKKIIACLIVVVCIAVIVFLRKNFIKELNISSLSDFVKNSGKYSVLVYLMVFALKPLVFFVPASIFSIVSGRVFGPVKGFILSCIGFLLSGSFAFILARVLGESFVQKLLKGKAIKLNDNMENNGFKILFFLRVVPVLPYDPLSYACGLTKIGYLDYILASILGILPETFCYCIIGENITNPFSVKFILPLAIVVITTVVSSYMFKKNHKQEKKINE